MKPFLLGGVILILAGCDDPAAWRGHAASLRVVMDSSITPGWFAVQVGDSVVVAQPGERSRCVIFDRLAPTRVLMSAHTPYGDGTAIYSWRVEPPYVDIWVDLQRVADSTAMFHVTWVNRTCGDTLLLLH